MDKKNFGASGALSMDMVLDSEIPFDKKNENVLNIKSGYPEPSKFKVYKF